MRRSIIGTNWGAAAITVELFAKPKPNDRHYYAYDVVLDGLTVVSNSRDPEHDLARALLARGTVGVAEIVDGLTGKARSTVILEQAARRGVGSNLDRYAEPYEIGKDSAPAGESRLGLGLSELPPDSTGAACPIVGFPQQNAASRNARSEAA